MEVLEKNTAIGKVKKAFGNLIHVEFEDNIRQGEIGVIELDGESFTAEVIEIAGREAKMQVFEDTHGIKLDTHVSFTSHLLEAELGPGLLTSIYDGLQNPLEKIAETKGFYLERGATDVAIDREKKWNFTPKAEVGQVVGRGDVLGSVQEGIFEHLIFVPFARFGKYTIEEITPAGEYNVDHTVARVKDESGKTHNFSMVQKWPIKASLQEGKKRSPEKMMDTGLRILDTQFPIVKGGTFCTPGPFGAGKTVLQHHLSKHSSVDIVIVAACGERAGEVVEVLRTFPELIDERTQKPLIDRTVIICNTSSMPVAAREASVYMGATIAEYYRQMGLDILLLADSTSRWAQAMREMSGRLEEIPGEEAFPAYLSSRIASFYERSGVIETRDGKLGSLTIGGAVSPAGGNFEEPVTQSTLSVVGAFIGLSRERSDARRYPAIDPLISWTKYQSMVGKELSSKVANWDEKVKRALWFLENGDEIQKRMEVVGEEGTALDEMIVYLKSELYEICYLQQNAFDTEDAYSPLERQIEMFTLIDQIFEKKFSFSSHEEARHYFFSLQSEMKNINYLTFQSEEYKRAIENVKMRIESEENL
jgi:V/A-type H+-transporting ATPase subunit A